MDTLSSRLKYAMQIKGVSQAELVRRTGINKGALSSYINGRYEPKQKAIYKIAKALNINEAWLLGYDVDMKATHETPPQNADPVLRIPLYDMISCGTGGFVDDQIIDYVVLPAEMFSPSKEYFAQYAHGDSMINAGIHDGDLVIFQKQSEPVNGMIGCFCIDDNTATCKRLSISGTQIILLPENPAYTPIIVPVESFKCLGKLAFVVSDRRDG